MVGQGRATETVAAAAAPSPGGSWLLEHWGLVVSLGGGGLVLVAVLGRAKFDPTTALGIIESLGPVDVLVRGVLMTALPFIITFGVQAAMVFPRPQLWFAHHPRAFGVFAGSALLLYAGAIPWPIALLPVGVLASGFRGVLRARGHEAAPNSIGFGRQAGVAAFAAFLATLLTAFLPWLPSHAISHPDTGTFTGYVLQVSEGSTTVLADEPRRIIRLDTARTTHQICATESRDWLAKPSALQLLPAFQTSVEYSACPTAAPRIPAGPR